jgi:hypothetical protein
VPDNLSLLGERGTSFQYPELGRFFLDCGAYSVLTGVWQGLPVNDYTEFVIRYQKKIQVLAAPDVIGSATETFGYLKSFVEVLRRRGEWEKLADRVLITYHLVDRDLITFSDMARWAYDRGVRWLAIGGIAGTGGSKEAKWAPLEAVRNLVYDKIKLPFKLHLFGGSSVDFVYHFRPDAVDSSAYLAKGKMLGLLRFDKKSGEMYSFNTQGFTNTEQVRVIIDILGRYNTEVDLKEFAREIVNCPPAIRCMVCNLATVGELETWVSVKVGKPHFKYWVSLDSGSFILASSRHGRYIAELFYKYWKDRCLFSYGTLYEEGGTVSLPWLRTFF